MPPLRNHLPERMYSMKNQPTPTNYAEALTILDAGKTRTSRDRKKIAPDTKLERQGEWPNVPRWIAVYLHNTPVVTFYPNGSTVLESGGWQTVTTKERINRYLPPGVSLSQERFLWYVQDWRPEFLPANADQWHKRYRVEFKDGLTILPDASLHGLERETRTADAK